MIQNNFLPPNCYGGKITPSGLIVHYFSCINVDPDNPYDIDNCRVLFEDLNLDEKDRTKYKDIGSKERLYASAHLLIGRENDCIKLVPENKKAYHAGVSYYKGLKNWNKFSLGVELVGSEDSGFTDFQYNALAWYTQMCMAKYGFSFDMVAGHETIAPDRKYDPGISTGNFDWARFEKACTYSID